MTIMTLALGACVGTRARPVLDERSAMEIRPLAFRFDNQARDHVHIYLIGQRREWLLGRVEPGAVATLEIPDELFDSDPGYVQLAVLTGGGVTLKAAHDPRAQLTIAQDPSSIASRQWRIAQGQLTSLGLASRVAATHR